jgi:hypothetical protein
MNFSSTVAPIQHDEPPHESRSRSDTSPERALEPGTGVAPLAETGDPDPSTLCTNLARCVIEILAGARPLDQIGRWVSDSVFVHLLRRTMLAARARAVAPDNSLRPRMQLGNPRLCFPSDDVVEGVVMVHQPGRSRAVAIRLERHRQRWRATAINVL